MAGMVIAASFPLGAAAAPVGRPVPATVIADLRGALAAEPYGREVYVPSVRFGISDNVLCGLVDAGRRGMPLRFIHQGQGAEPAAVDIDDGIDAAGFSERWRAAGCATQAP